MRHRHLRPAAGALLFCLGITACSASPPVTTSAARVSATAGSVNGAATPTASGTPASTPTPRSSPAKLSDCPATRPLAALPTLATLSGDADDLAVTPAGHIWLSLTAQGRLLELDSGGRVLRNLAEPGAPEGIVPLGDGRLAIALQTANRIDILDPASGATTTLITLPRGVGDGLDGIATDGPSALLVPNSSAGTLLRVPLDGGTVTTIASGLGRPVAAAVVGDGSRLVAEENSPGLVRVSATGSVTAVTGRNVLRSVDEVVLVNGLAYVTDLLAGTLDAVDPASGQVRVLVDQSPAPQGLAVAGAGGLLLVDSTRQVIVAVSGCSVR